MASSSLLLLAEPDAASLAVHSAWIQELGFQTVTATVAEEALELARARGPALMVVDAGMRRPDGVELADQLNENEATRAIPLIGLIRGGPAHEPPPAELGESFDVLLREPFDRTSLRAAIEQAFDLSRGLRKRSDAIRQRTRNLVARSDSLQARSASAVGRTLVSPEEVLSTVAHELRQPLNAMAGAVFLLETEQEPEVSARARRVLKRQLRQLTRLVEDLLDLSRLERWSIRTPSQPIDLCEVVRDAVDAGRAQLAERQQEVALELPARPVRMLADEARLQQILSNLLANAGSYSPPGGRVEVTLRLEDARAVLRVADSGPGIRKDVLPRLFEPFAKPSPERKAGLGIGLAIARALVELHGGSIEARPRPSRAGTEFVVSLPVLAISNAETEGENEAT